MLYEGTIIAVQWHIIEALDLTLKGKCEAAYRALDRADRVVEDDNPYFRIQKELTKEIKRARRSVDRVLVGDIGALKST